MDTEEHIEIQKAKSLGHPPTDEGPYYHESWWESYKGSVRGKLGGAVVGALIGAVIGGITVAILPLAGAVITGTVGTMIAGFSAAGMMYGFHEFSDIGKTVGSNAAVAEIQEQRDSKRFAALERKLNDIKSLLFGKKPEGKTAGADAPIDDIQSDDPLPYRTTHSNANPDLSPQKWVFWKIAAVGLVIGLAAGALLAAGGVAGHVLQGLGVLNLTGANEFVGAMTAMGLFGASYGINRDVFRQVFDKTDLWFKGLFSNTVSQAQEPQKIIEKQSIATVVYPPGLIDYPTSATHHQDKLAAAAKMALLNLDPSKTISH